MNQKNGDWLRRQAEGGLRDECAKAPIPIFRRFLLLLAAALVPAIARAELLSVAELNDKVEQWRSGRKEPPPVVFQVEGRAARLDRFRVQFRNCRLPFEADDELPEPTRRNANLEVTGLVERSAATGEYRFRIQSARELPNDLETYLERRREIRRGPAAKWHRLGDWARRRGEFYKDHELLARSDEAHRRGVELERKELAGNPDGLFALAERAQAFGLPREVADEMRHEAVVVLWRAATRKDGGDLAPLLETIAGRLPAAETPLSHPHGDLWKEYLADPVEAYRKADAETRRKLHRLLYADVRLRALTAELAPDGANGFDVASQIEQAVPEHRARADALRNQALAARAKEVETLSRVELLSLAQQYRDRDQPRTAEQLVESWLTLRLRRLDPEDSEGLISLTDEYRRLLGRNDVANRLLLDAWGANRKATDIAERLTQAGFRLHEERWLTEAEYAVRPAGQLEQAIRAGRVEPGMTASHVRRSLGEPQRLSRAATAGELTEVWTYDDGSGGTRLTVRLRKNRRHQDLSVVDVSQSAAP